jgi:hypothetical protein
MIIIERCVIIAIRVASLAANRIKESGIVITIRAVVVSSSIMLGIVSRVCRTFERVGTMLRGSFIAWVYARYKYVK